MGTYYDIYAEIRFNGVWINIDNRILGLDGKVHHAPLISGQSWLWEALQELSEDIYVVPFDKLADGTKEVFSNIEQAKEHKFEAVDFQTAIKDKIKSSPARRGYVNRICIEMFQTGETDHIEEWLTPADYADLEKPEQQDYSYYEWDDRDGWYAIFKQVAGRVDFLVDSFNDCGIPYEMYKNLDETDMKTKDVRLIITQS